MYTPTRPTGSESLARCMQTIHAYPMVSAEKELALSRRWRDTQDLAAAHNLVTCHLRLVGDDHQVNINRLYRAAADHLRSERPNGDVRNRPAIRHVDVDPACTSGVHGVELILYRPKSSDSRDGHKNGLASSEALSHTRLERIRSAGDRNGRLDVLHHRGCARRATVSSAATYSVDLASTPDVSEMARRTGRRHLLSVTMLLVRLSGGPHQLPGDLDVFVNQQRASLPHITNCIYHLVAGP